MRRLLNWYLNDVYHGDYFFAIFFLFIGIVVTFAVVSVVVATHGIVFIPVLLVAGVWALLRWADEERT